MRVVLYSGRLFDFGVMMVETTLTNGLILPKADEPQDWVLKDIFIREGRIEAIITAGERRPEGTIVEAAGCLVTPGLINSHHHSHEHYHKGRYDRVPLELWMNYVRPLTPIPVTPRHVYLRTLIGAIQALRSGTTTIVDDLNVSPQLDPVIVNAAFQAYRDIGIRAMVGLTLFDKPFYRALPFVDEEFPNELLVELDQVKTSPASETLEFVKSLARQHHPSSARVAAILAPSAPQRCTDIFLQEIRAVADDLDLPIIIHVHETRLQAVTAQLFYGKSMFKHLGDLNFLGPKTQLIHAIWTAPSDIQLLAETGTSVQHNPNSNLKLGSGLMPLRAYLDAGVNVSLGTDGCGSIDTLDMLRTVASTALVHKLRGDDHSRWVDAADSWSAGTLGGAKALGFEGKLGEIAVDAKADLCCYRLTSAAFTPLNNPLRQLVYGETGADLETILVDGDIVMLKGQLTCIDENAILAEAQEAHQELEPFIACAETHVDKMMPAYQRIYSRCQKMLIDPDILPARFPE